MRRVLVLVCLCLAACAATLQATGDGLLITDDTFEATAAAMTTAMHSGTVSKDQYRAFAAFAKRFKPSRAIAEQAWKDARQAGNNAGADAAAADLKLLLAELSKYEALVLLVANPDGGAP